MKVWSQQRSSALGHPTERLYSIMDIVTLGELLIDMFPAEQGKGLTSVSAFHPKPGGAPANVAVAASRLGRQTAFIGKVGDDPFGRFLIQVLAEEGVETRGIALDREARTTMAFIAKPDPDHAEYVFYRNPGADHRLEASELDETLLRSTIAFHFGSLSLTYEPARSATWAAVDIARAAGSLVSFDVNYRPALWDNPAQAIDLTLQTLPGVDMIKVNEGEASLISGREVDPADQDSLHAAASTILDRGIKAVILTLGPQGSFFEVETGYGYVPGFEVNTVDAVGCGDSFVAGLLSQLVGDSDWKARLEPAYLEQALRYANAVGALTSLTQGVIPALPSAEQVDAFLKNR